jgi:Uma2 family endonuclease
MMASDPRSFLSPEQYLERERKAETRNEYSDGQVFPMEGTTRNHARITLNLASSLHQQLRGTRCNAYSQTLLVQAGKSFAYPDIVVTCGEEHFLDQQTDVLLNPVLIIEVLSPSTADYDRGGKFERYRTISSLREYVTVAQDQILIEQHIRQENGWLLVEHRDPLGSWTAAALQGVLTPIVDIYEKVNWPEEST